MMNATDTEISRAPAFLEFAAGLRNWEVGIALAIRRLHIRSATVCLFALRVRVAFIEPFRPYIPSKAENSQD